MNKVFLPTILIATALIAGAFAMIPVDQASTVHTTIEAATGTLVSETGVNVDLATADVIIFDLSGGSEVAHGEICLITVDSGTGSSLTALIETGTTLELVNNAGVEAVTGACAEFSAQKLTVTQGAASSVVDFSVTFISDDV